MDLPVERWYQAISERYSRRQFNGQPVKPETICSLEGTIGSFRPFDDVRAVVVTQPPDDVFKGAVGNYGKVRNAPSYLALIGQEDSSTVHENTGYYGEGLLLEATALGLCTCWVGGFYKPEEVAKQIDLKAGERVFAISPLGHAPEKDSLEEKMMSHRTKRKPLEAIIGRRPLGEIPSWLKTALEATRVAPSSMNRQPWVFSLGEREVTVSMGISLPMSSVRRFNRLDCGIAMLHFQLGAAHAGVTGKWEHQADPQVGRFVPQG